MARARYNLCNLSKHLLLSQIPDDYAHLRASPQTLFIIQAIVLIQHMYVKLRNTARQSPTRPALGRYSRQNI